MRIERWDMWNIEKSKNCSRGLMMLFSNSNNRERASGDFYRHSKKGTDTARRLQQKLKHNEFEVPWR